LILSKIERRLRFSGILITAGLLIEAMCLLWARPLAFIVLVGLAGFFVAAGIALYLYSLVSARESHPVAMSQKDH
jgi:hypothetical protein